MNNPKLPVISAAVGFVVSFIAGIFSGAPFGIMLLRAFLSAVGVAGFVFLASFLIRKFLPELADGGSRDADADKDSPGANVDITVDDFPAEGSADAPTFHMSAPRTEESSGSSVNADGTAFGDGAPSEHGGLSGDGEAAPVGEQASPDGSLNALPDIGTLMDEGSGTEGVSEESSDTLSAGPVSSAEGTGGADMLNMVKAIRTVLAKD